MVLDRWDGKQRDTLEHDDAFDRTRRQTRDDGRDTDCDIAWFRRFDKRPRFDKDYILSYAWFPGKLVMRLLDSRLDVTGEIDRDLLDDNCVCAGGVFAVVREGRSIVSRQSSILKHTISDSDWQIP